MLNNKNKQYLIFLSLGLVFVLSGCFNKVVKDENVVNVGSQPVVVNENVKDNNSVEIDNNANSNNKNDNSIKHNKDGEIDTSDWLTYRNEEYGFEVKYPKNWFVNDYYYDAMKRKAFSFINFKGSNDEYNKKFQENPNTEKLRSLSVVIYSKKNNTRGLEEYNRINSDYIKFANEILTYKKNKSKIKLYVVTKRTVQKDNVTWDWALPEFKAFLETEKYNYIFRFSTGYSDNERNENLEMFKKILEFFSFINEKENNNEKISTSKSIKTSIVLSDFSCQQGNNYAKFNILKENQLLNNVTVSNCEFKKGEILKTNNKYIYFSILPGGVGGYILYGKYVNLYKLNLSDNSITMLLENKFFDIDFSFDSNFIVYNSKDNIVVKNLNTNQESLYESPAKKDNAQFGSFKFSPNLDKVAIAVGYGPDNEYGEIYILDLKNRVYELYKQTVAPPQIEKWIDNDKFFWH